MSDMGGRWLTLLGLIVGGACVPLDGFPALPGLAGLGAGVPKSNREEKAATVTHEERREESSWSSWGGGTEAEEAEPPEPPRPEPKKKKGQTVAEREIEDIGATCNRNTDCEAKACYTYGNGLGYCTKMCNSWSDCPSHWECRRPGNAPQQICIQGS